MNSGISEWDRTIGDYAIRRWAPPADQTSAVRTVPVSLHVEVDMGTLRGIADRAGAKEYDEFSAWIERNRWSVAVGSENGFPVARWRRDE